MFETFEQWEADRLGKFTASEIWKLVEGGRGGEYFGKGAKSYIRLKAAEILTLEPNNGGRVNSNALEWGNSHEFEAADRFAKETGLHVDYYGGASPKFFEFTNFSGGSPDCIINSDTVGEIKCPYNSGEHIEHLLLNNADDLKSYYPEAYWQLTFNMICTGLRKATFISYDPRYADEALQLKTISFDIDEEDELLIKERVAEAEKQLGIMITLVREIINQEVE